MSFIAAFVCCLSANKKAPRLLGRKMFKEAYGISGCDLTRGADILVKAALSDEFAEA